MNYTLLNSNIYLLELNSNIYLLECLYIYI